MYFTFEFHFAYQESEYDCVQFCGENIEEAMELFRDFCKENDYKVVGYDYSLVYNEEDEQVYGNEYASQRDMNDYARELAEYQEQKLELAEEEQAQYDAYYERQEDMYGHGGF